MKLNKLISMLLVLIVLVSAAFVSASAEKIVFTDVPETHWAAESIYRWVDAGVINGSSKDGKLVFRMDDPMTRGEFAKVMSVVLGLTEKAPNNFADLQGKDDVWYTPYILRCAAAGIMKGDTNGNANPEAYITRQEAFAMYARTLKMTPGTAADLARFVDADQFAEWAIPESAAVVNYKGSVGNTKNEIQPNSNISRAEVVKILDRLIAVYVDANGGLSVTTESEQANAGNFVVISAANPGWVYACTEEDGWIYLENKNDFAKIQPANGMDPEVVFGTDSVTLAAGSDLYVPGSSSTLTYHIPLSDASQYESEYSSGSSKTEYVYDEDWNMIAKKIYEDGELLRTETVEADENGNILKIMNGDEILSEYAYNEAGRVVEIKDYEDSVLSCITTYEYNADGYCSKITTTWVEGDETTYTLHVYDENGNLTETKEYNENDVLIRQDAVELDANGRTVKETSTYYYDDGSVNRLYSYEFDDNHNCVKETQEEYDEDGTLVLKQVITNTFDDYRALSSVTTDMDGQESYRQEYTYDEDGRQTGSKHYSYGELSIYSVTTYEESGKEITTDYDLDGTVLSTSTNYLIENEDGSWTYYYDNRSDSWKNSYESHYRYVELPYDANPIFW